MAAAAARKQDTVIKSFFAKMQATQDAVTAKKQAVEEAVVVEEVATTRMSGCTAPVLK